MPAQTGTHPITIAEDDKFWLHFRSFVHRIEQEYRTLVDTSPKPGTVAEAAVFIGATTAPAMALLVDWLHFMEQTPFPADFIASTRHSIGTQLMAMCIPELTTQAEKDLVIQRIMDAHAKMRESGAFESAKPTMRH